MSNLRVNICEDRNHMIVQVKDEEYGWLCCHNNNMEDLFEEDLEMDLHDVKEYNKDPNGLTCNWCNPYLRRLQKENNNYKEIE